MTTISSTASRGPGFASAFTALCVGAAAMGISPLFVRVAGEAGVGPFASAFWRVALALPVLYAWMRIEEAHARPGPARRRFGPATILAGMVFAGDLFVWHLSILNTTIANATFLATTAPFFVVIVTWAVLRQRVSRGTLIGLVLCLLGGGALIGQSLQVDPGRLRGDLYGLATAFFFGLYFIVISRARETGGAARVTFEATLVTSVILLAVALWLDGRLLPASYQGSVTAIQLAAALLAMGVVSHAGGQGLLSVALGRLPATFSSLVIFLEALVAAIAGWVVLGERLTLVQILGGALILFGIWIARPKAAGAP